MRNYMAVVGCSGHSQKCHPVMKQGCDEQNTPADTEPSPVELKLPFPGGYPAFGMQKLLTDCKFDLDLKGLSNSNFYVSSKAEPWGPALPLGHHQGSTQEPSISSFLHTGSGASAACPGLPKKAFLRDSRGSPAQHLARLESPAGWCDAQQDTVGT